MLPSPDSASYPAATFQDIIGIPAFAETLPAQVSQIFSKLLDQADSNIFLEIRMNYFALPPLLYVLWARTPKYP